MLRTITLAQGITWSVDDVLCSFGPADRPFEEQHNGVSIAIVVAGTFQYRTASSPDVLVPGSLLLGNHGQAFECKHDHSSGDRCLSFRFEPDLIEQLAADTGVTDRRFRVGRIPPIRDIAPLVARASAALKAGTELAWEQLALQLAARSLGLAQTRTRTYRVPRGAEARVANSVREIENGPHASHTIESLAEQAALSPYHYLRTFQRVTGVTPHQYLLRTRLRNAATQLIESDAKVSDIAYQNGFGDLSNFNHAFRAEFGVNPTAYRRAG